MFLNFSYYFPHTRTSNGNANNNVEIKSILKKHIHFPNVDPDESDLLKFSYQAKGDNSVFSYKS